MPDTPTPGQVAYAVFWQTMEQTIGSDIDPWTGLHHATQAAWEAAAQAVLPTPFAFPLGARVTWHPEPEVWTIAARRWTEAGRTAGYAEYGLARGKDSQWTWALESELRRID